MTSPEIKSLSQLPDGFEADLPAIDGNRDNQFADVRRARKTASIQKEVFDQVFGSPVLRCFVASSFDGLLYAGYATTEELMNKPFIERKKIAERTEKHTKGGCWIPFDVKSVKYPTLTSDSRKEEVSKAFQEENCQFVINSYDLAPETLVLIPRTLMHLATKATQDPDGLLLATATRIPRGLAHLAFPIHLLPKALENVRQAAISTGVYVNPHWGNQIPFKPKLFRLSEVNYTPISITSLVSAVRRFSILSNAIEMSQKRKEGYFLDLHPYQPFGCDAIIHGPGNAEWDVEIKLRSNMEAGSSLVLHYDIDERGFRDPMALSDIWNFLMLYDESEKFCYWIPRDKMKLEWSPTYQGFNGSGVICIPKQDVAAFRIDCRHSNWFSYVVGRIILPNKDVLPDTHPSLEQIAEARSNPNLNFLSPDRVEPSSLFSIFQAMCAMSKQGLLLVLDKDDPTGNYAYVRWNWTEQQVQTFFYKGISPSYPNDFSSPEEPAIPIHLHHVSTSGGSQGQDVAHHSVDVGKWRKKKHIFIGDTLLNQYKWNQSRGVWLIPSGECRDEPKAMFYRHSSEKISALLVDYLPKDKLASSYIVSSNYIAQILQNFMEDARRSSDKPVRLGGAQVIPGDYITTVGDLMR